MATNYNPRTVTDGLVLCLDAGNTKSYPGTGTTWTDISRNGNDGSLVNMDGANLDSANGGSLTFDGSNEYVDADTLTAFGDNDPITVEAWINADSLTNLYQVIATVKANTNHWQLSYSGDPTYNLFFTFTGNQIIGTSTLPPTGKWHHIVVTYNGGSKTDISSYKIYSSALQQNISLKGISGAANNKTIIGFRDGGQGSNYFDGKIAQVKIYNKVLTQEEVQQNFNVTRDRFGV